jgi:hypothetical protein
MSSLLATAVHLHYTHGHRILNTAKFSLAAYSTDESLQYLQLPESRHSTSQQT